METQAAEETPGAAPMTLSEFIEIVGGLSMITPDRYLHPVVQRLARASSIAGILRALGEGDFETALDLLAERERDLQGLLDEADTDLVLRPEVAQTNSVANAPEAALESKPTAQAASNTAEPPIADLPEGLARRIETIWRAIGSIPSSMFRAEFRARTQQASDLLREDPDSQAAEAMLASVETELQELAA